MPADRSSAISGNYAYPQASSARIKFRRAITLALMTLIVPGSAQLAVGNKRIGRIAIRIWLAAIVIGAIGIFLALTSRRTFLDLVIDSPLVPVARWALIGLAVFWVYLLADAWRLGAPRELARSHRVFVTAFNSVLCVVCAGVLLFSAHILAVQQGLIGTVFAAEKTSSSESGRYNVLLLGGDSGKGRNGLRPDSLTVASIDEQTGRTVLIGLPRNLAKVPFPEGTPMAKAFPQGFNCAGCYLNGVNTWANDHKTLFAADTSEASDAPGLEATKDAVGEVTGLKINYYAMVNLKGFKSLVDAVGGVKINVKDRIAIGGIGSPIYGYIEPGTQVLNGKEALWYSRSRVQSNDYARMGRQKCMMSAMLHQLSPTKVLFNVNAIAKSGKELLSTDIPKADLSTFLDLSLKARSAKVSTVSITPPTINTGDPNYDKIRRMITKAIDTAEGRKPNGFITTTLPKIAAPAQAYDPQVEAKKANETT
ncbi:MAG: LytR family transcriptional regulator, partial [Nocardioidaceae bacterium]|nr:LytR family transcriptional regulator [Nocardioidaceae bacterium]